MKSLDGNKTYITAGLFAVLSIGHILGWITQDQLVSLGSLAASFGLFSVRDAIKKLE